MTKIKNAIKGNKSLKKSIPNLVAQPNYVCFKNYEEGQVYKEHIKVVNQDDKPFHISVKFDNPEEIKLSTLSQDPQTILDNGDDILLEIEFRPILSFNKESVDRRYEISISIDNSNTKLFIPVIILSPNPSINIPREIQLPSTAIDMPAYTNICILNYSNHSYKFSIDTKSEIKIIPECKVIAMKSGDGISFLVEFIPRTLNDFREKIYICFENDKRMSILLKCNVLPMNIFMIQDSIEFQPTLIGMRDMKSIQIVNNSETATLFQWMPIENHCANENNEEHPSLKYLEIYPMNGELSPQTITKVDLIFKPEDTNDDEDDFEFQKEIVITLALKLEICHNYNPSIIVKGKVVGPSFQLDHKIINIDDIFVGESRNIDVNLKNIGDISGKVFFHKIQSVNDGIIKASSKIESLKAGEVKKFRIKFLARKIGKFIDSAIFKVKNAEKLTLSIQGVIKPLNITSDSVSIQFPSSAICVPQMKFLKLANDHPFDVDIRLEIENNGNDDPLEFLEFYGSRSATITDTISKSSSLESMNNNNHNNITTESCSSLLTRTSIKNFMERSGEMEQLRDTITMSRDEIVEIFNKVDDYLIRKEIISMILDDKLCNEVEMHQIVQTVVELLIENLTDSNDLKFYEKDWLLPEHPRQIECNKKLIKIKSKSFEEVKIFIVPNYIGKFTRNLKLFIVMSDVGHPVDETIVNIPIVIDCQSADIKIHNQTNEISGYAESQITLDINVENLTSIDGFFTFQNFHDTEMDVKCSDEKFHISGKSMKILNLIIIPLISGKIIKYMNIIALGSNRKYPITIECKSLPPDIIINPKKICVNDLVVLKKNDTRIFIENCSTTKARFFVKLEHDNQCFNINPRGGILSSKQCTVVMLEKFFHDPGDYHDILIVEIVNSKVIRIPIRCTVKKLPITIEPSLCNIIDFGTLFTSKSSYYLDYKFTNCGKISYMIFIILKKCKNRSEIRYTIEPNRFELSPNCSRVVKFCLNALNALSCIDDFTIEGCSIHFPIRELIWESKLKANVIKPTINFSTNELIFNCFYGQEDDLMDSFEISNGSALPLTVALKIDGKFSIYVNELNTYEQKVRFDLKVKESRKIFINFNSNHLKNYNMSRTFEGTITAYSLGQYQSTLKLIAHLIYPEIELSSNDVNIIVNPKQSCTSNFIISNPSDKLTASFELKFKDNSTIITSIHEKRHENLLNIEQCLMKQKSNLRNKKDSNNYKIFYDGDDFEAPDVTNDDVKDESNDSNSQNSNDINSLKSIEVSPKEITKFFNLMSQEIPEFKFNEEPEVKLSMTSNDEQDQCFLMLSQMEGILKPLENRIIDIQFHGSNKVITPKIENEAAELIEGYVKLSCRTPSEFTLDEAENIFRDLKFSIFPGCMPIFETEFDLQVNDKSPIPIQFYSQNTMPMATLLDINRKSLYDLHKTFEYDCLREMFKYVDRIRVHEEVINVEDVSKAKLKFQELLVEREKKARKKSVKKRKTTNTKSSIDSLSAGDSCDLMPKELRLVYGENGKASMCEKRHKIFSGKMLQIVDEEIENGDFLALDYPNEYPQSHDIINFIAQYGFAKSLEADDIYCAYKSIYDRYVVEKFRHSKKLIGCREQCCDNSVVVPLPLVLVEYSLDFGDVKIGDVYEKIIKLYLHADFTSVAIRSEASIPDFLVEFLPYSEFFKVNSYKIVDFPTKYINRQDRQLLLSEEQTYEVRRCHSFDFIEGKVHSRIISKTKENFDQINQTYNEKMSPKVKFDDRSPYTLTEIFQKAEFNEKDLRVIEFKIVFSPKIDNYDEVKMFDEVLYIDVS
ncbi:hydrocephalus-inducing protein homolog [Chironomus tepperi]|uniref:hydrocephalus-inducing protein homolog n=1 Tax=Chironomus tepperi TaxID=113505 RepID=UPI00391F665F